MPELVDCPIRIEVNANCFLMEDMGGVLDLQFINQLSDESFKIETRLSSHIFPRKPKRKLTLNGEQTKKRSIQLSLPRRDENHSGSAGRALVDIELLIDAGEDGKHRFTGEFQLTVLAYSENRNEVNVNIGNVIEQHGDKAGMGGINEVDLSNMIKLPAAVSVNDLLTQKRTARYVAIDLEYEGIVENEPVIEPRIIKREGIKPIDRCTLVCEGSEMRTLVLASNSIMLGRSRAKADIVTWLMPLNDENHHRTRMISQEQVKLYFDHDNGPSARLVSRSSSSQLDRTLLDRRTPVPLPLKNPSSLHLHEYFALKITPLPMPDIPAEWQYAWLTDADIETHHRWTWARRNKVGGFLIEREDALKDRECYVWLIAAISDTTNTDSGTAEAAMNLLHVNGHPMMARLAGGGRTVVSGNDIEEACAMPIIPGDQCSRIDGTLEVQPYEQCLS